MDKELNEILRQIQQDPENPELLAKYTALMQRYPQSQSTKKIEKLKEIIKRKVFVQTIPLDFAVDGGYRSRRINNNFRYNVDDLINQLEKYRGKDAKFSLEVDIDYGYYNDSASVEDIGIYLYAPIEETDEEYQKRITKEIKKMANTKSRKSAAKKGWETRRRKAKEKEEKERQEWLKLNKIAKEKGWTK